MNRLFKIISTIIALIVLIIIIAIVLMILFINPNRFKPLIIKEIYDETGRTLTMPGDITWSFFPTISITTSSITLSNPAGYTQAVFVHANSAKAEVLLFPLLSGNVKPKNITLSGAQLYLIKNKQGEENWQQWGASPTTHLQTTTKSNTTSATSLFNILLPNINITDSDVHYIDETTNQSFTLSNLNLQAKKVHLNTPFPLLFTTDFSSKNPDASGHINLNATVIIDKKSLTVNNINLTGQLTATQTKNQAISFTLTGNTSFAADRISLQPITLQIANLNANGYLTLTNLRQARYMGALNVKSFNACDFLGNFSLHLPCHDKNTLNQLQLSTVFSGDQSTFSIEAFDTKIDNGTINAKLNIDKLETRTGKFSLYLNHINIDRYLDLLPKTPTKTATTAAHHQANNTIQLPAVVKNYNVAGTISAKDFTVNKIHLDSLETQLVSNYGFINLYPLTANLYHGQLTGAIAANFKPLQPTFTIRLSLENIDLQPMLIDMFNFKDASGNLTFHTNVTTHGINTQTLKEHLHGQASIHLLNGALKNMDISYYYQEGLALLRGEKTSATKTNVTHIGSLTALFNIEKGIARNNDFNLTSHDFTVTGAGMVNLPRNTLDYLLHVNDKNGHVIPLTASGPLTSPSVRIDVEQAVKQNAEKQLKNKLKNALDGLGF